MKQIASLILILFLSSCSNNERELKNEIIRLRAENKKLTDSKNFNKLQEIVNLQMELTSESQVIKVNQGNKIQGSFRRYEKMPKYDLYQVNDITKIRKKLFENMENPNFEFTYKPTSKNDTLLRVSAVMKIGDKKVELPGRLDFIVK